MIAEWLASGRQIAPASSIADKPTLSVNEVMLAFLDFADGYYCDGKELSKEIVNCKLALRPLNQLYGHIPAEQFGPLALKALRQHMIEVQSLCHKEINKRIGPIKRLFKWAASEELVPASVFEGLRTVEGLRVGRATCPRESTDQASGRCDRGSHAAVCLTPSPRHDSAPAADRDAPG